MSEATSLELDEEVVRLVGARIRTGRYSSASDVVRAGLRLLDEQEDKVRALQTALKAGEDSGAPKPFDNEAFKARMRARRG